MPAAIVNIKDLDLVKALNKSEIISLKDFCFVVGAIFLRGDL